MQGLPVTFRLLDPPLHEFVPHDAEKLQELSKELGIRISVLKRRVLALHENNPMLGHRGCRLGVVYPEITEMQARAIFEAAIEASLSTGEPVDIEIPDVDQPAVTAQTQDTLAEWENSGPVGQFAANTVRDTVAAAPAIDAQVRDFVAAQPGGQQVIEQVDAALTDFFQNASPGLASTLISQAIGDGAHA